MKREADQARICTGVRFTKTNKERAVLIGKKKRQQQVSKGLGGQGANNYDTL